MSVKTDYLDAIQAIPGVTAGEKFRWIGELIKERLTEYNSLEDVLELEKIPRPLVALVQVQAAVALMKKNPKEQSAYSAITEALKSEDESVVCRALRANSFFDGTNKTVTNVRFFFENLFPYVSLNSRTRIVKTLSHRLSSKNPQLAEEFFTAVASYYSLKQALPLLLACSESFAYNAIVENRIVLSRGLIKQMMRKNPDFVVRYLRLSKPNPESCTRNIHPVNINELGNFLARLIKKRLDSFVELYEMHEKNPPKLSLSRKCAEAFLKNGNEHLLRKPRLYINLVPLKIIGNCRMDSIFPKLFPDNVRDSNVGEMLAYLEYCPQDRKVDLFLNSYQQAYGKSILDNPNQVTFELMKILPPEERIKQARIKLEKETEPYQGMNYEICWKCYLPVAESIPYFKNEIAMSSQMEIRSALACKMIYSCNVNNDDQALLEVLEYLASRHRNEQPWFLMQLFDTLLNLYDLPPMNNKYWTILIDMITYSHVKNELSFRDSTSIKMLEAAIHHKILQKETIDPLIEIFIDLRRAMYLRHWNILQKYPEYEKMCLEACVRIVTQNYDSVTTMWHETRDSVIYDLCVSIYHFNEFHQCSKKSSRLGPMSIKNYPWLLEIVVKILRTDVRRENYVIQDFKNMLKKHEKDLYERFFPETKNAILVEEMLKTLKENTEEIRIRWQEYLELVCGFWYKKQVQQFVKATRWYKDIPIKFVEQSIKNLECSNPTQGGAGLNILSLLVRGETFAKIVEPFIPEKNIIDLGAKNVKTNYFILRNVIFASNNTNPPMPLTIIARLCDEGDLLSLALAAIVNVTRRTNSMDAIAFARTLSNQRVSVRKHGIRLMDMIAPRTQLIEFLRVQWDAEKNHSIREVLFNKIMQLFEKEPSSDTWSLLFHVISSLTPNDVKLTSQTFSSIDSIPDEFLTDFIKLSLNTIDKFEEGGVHQSTIVSYTCNLLNEINAAICNFLSEDFVKELVRRYFFHRDKQISDSASTFVIRGLLLPAKDKFDLRMNIFSSLFMETVKTSWNVPHPEKKNFYPVNNIVHHFAQSVALESGYFDTKLRLIDGILPMFGSILTPQMDASSYLLLVYAKERMSVETPKEFGIKIGQKLPELINIFSPLFIFFIADTLKSMLDSSTMFDDYDYHGVNLEIIEGLTEIRSEEAMLMAVKLLSPIKSDEYAERYDKLVTNLSKYNHPVVKSIVCDIINKRTFE